MTDQTFYETSDTYVASYLLTKRVPYRGCFLSKDGLVTFRFAKSASNDRIRDLVDDYSFDGECPAKALLTNYRFLMAQVQQARRNEKAVTQ